MPPRSSHTSVSPTASGVPSDRTPSNRSASPPMDTRETVDQRPTRVHILPTKIQPTVLGELIGLVERPATALHGDGIGLHLELTADLDHADVIVTAIHTRPRLERHITWDVAKTKAIVTPDWLRDSVSSGAIQPYGKYATLRGLRGEAERVCPEVETTRNPVPRALPNYHGQIPPFVDPEAIVKGTDLAALDYLSQFCCQRASPLICPNQPLVKELDIIRRERMFEGEERSMLSYARAMSAIKAYPYRFNNQTSPEDIAKLPYLGVKLTSMVAEFAETGKISEAQNILSSTRFLSLSVFNSIHGIGPHTARHLYSLGLRTIEDLEKYYEVSPGLTSESSFSHLQSGDSKEIGVEKSIQVSLSLRHDFSQKISRQESEEINRVVMRELESIEPGCKSLIVGGYRRGKPESNDVDIVISHTNWDPDADNERSLCKKLTQRLHERGLVKHVLNMSGYHPHNVFRTHHWDSLEKALTVFLLPDNTARKQIHRRVDLIFATPDVFWTAVVGWTGSTMFQRDLRLWAKKQRGFKFDSSGITRRHDSQPFYPKSEREVFELLGLAYVHPTLRNTDV